MGARWRISRRGGRTLFSDHGNLARDRIDLSYRRRRALRSVTTFERVLERCCRRTSISGWLLDLAKTPLKSLMFGRIKVHVHVLWSPSRPKMQRTGAHTVPSAEPKKLAPFESRGRAHRATVLRPPLHPKGFQLKVRYLCPFVRKSQRCRKRIRPPY